MGLGAILEIWGYLWVLGVFVGSGGICGLWGYIWVLGAIDVYWETKIPGEVRVMMWPPFAYRAGARYIWSLSFSDPWHVFAQEFGRHPRAITPWRVPALLFCIHIPGGLIIKLTNSAKFILSRFVISFLNHFLQYISPH
jgi:hypothetical protein